MTSVPFYRRELEPVQVIAPVLPWRGVLGMESESKVGEIASYWLNSGTQTLHTPVNMRENQSSSR
jgi:hypothetical protein